VDELEKRANALIIDGRINFPSTKFLDENLDLVKFIIENRSAKNYLIRERVSGLKGIGDRCHTLGKVNCFWKERPFNSDQFGSHSDFFRYPSEMADLYRSALKPSNPEIVFEYSYNIKINDFFNFRYDQEILDRAHSILKDIEFERINPITNCTALSAGYIRCALEDSDIEVNDQIRMARWMDLVINHTHQELLPNKLYGLQPCGYLPLKEGEFSSIVYKSIDYKNKYMGVVFSVDGFDFIPLVKLEGRYYYDGVNIVDRSFNISSYVSNLWQVFDLNALMDSKSYLQTSALVTEWYKLKERLKANRSDLINEEASCDWEILLDAYIQSRTAKSRGAKRNGMDIFDGYLKIRSDMGRAFTPRVGGDIPKVGPRKWLKENYNYTSFWEQNFEQLKENDPCEITIEKLKDLKFSKKGERLSKKRREEFAKEQERLIKEGKIKKPKKSLLKRLFSFSS
jgi:hypothetical protein